MNKRWWILMAVLVLSSGCVAYYPYSYTYRPYPYGYYYPYGSYYGYAPYWYPAYRPPVYYAPGWPFWYPSISLGFGYSWYGYSGGYGRHRHGGRH